MIISHKYKFIFFCPTGNCATTSVQKALLSFHDDDDIKNAHESNFSHPLNESNPFNTKKGFRGTLTPTPEQGDATKKLIVSKHINPRDFLKHGVFDKNKFDSYTKFAIIRNPWGLVLAHFWKNFISYGERKKMKEGSITLGEKSFPAQAVQAAINYILNGPNFTLSQYETLCGTDYMDVFIKFENLKKDFSSLLNRLGVPLTTLGHEQDNHNITNYQKVYSDEGRELVREAFEVDCEKFDYTF